MSKGNCIHDSLARLFFLSFASLSLRSRSACQNIPGAPRVHVCGVIRTASDIHGVGLPQWGQSRVEKTLGLYI